APAIVAAVMGELLPSRASAVSAAWAAAIAAGAGRPAAAASTAADGGGGEEAGAGGARTAGARAGGGARAGVGAVLGAGADVGRRWDKGSETTVAVSQVATTPTTAHAPRHQLSSPPPPETDPDPEPIDYSEEMMLADDSLLRIAPPLPSTPRTGQRPAPPPFAPSPISASAAGSLLLDPWRSSRQNPHVCLNHSRTHPYHYNRHHLDLDEEMYPCGLVGADSCLFLSGPDGESDLGALFGSAGEWAGANSAPECGVWVGAEGKEDADGSVARAKKRRISGDDYGDEEDFEVAQPEMADALSGVDTAAATDFDSGVLRASPEPDPAPVTPQAPTAGPSSRLSTPPRPQLAIASYRSTCNAFELFELVPNVIVADAPKRAHTPPSSPSPADAEPAAHQSPPPPTPPLARIRTAPLIEAPLRILRVQDPAPTATPSHPDSYESGATVAVDLVGYLRAREMFDLASAIENPQPAPKGTAAWIPTTKARRLAQDLNILPQLSQLLDAGPAGSDGELEMQLHPVSPALKPMLLAPGPITARSAVPGSVALGAPPPLSLAPPRITDGSLVASAPLESAAASVPAVSSAAAEEDDPGDRFLVFEDEDEWSGSEGSGSAGPAVATRSASPPASVSGSISTADAEDSAPPVVIDPATLALVHPLHPLAPPIPPMYMTTIDGVILYITWVGKQGSESDAAPPLVPTPPARSTPLIRRADNNMVNATLLLHAGGMHTERERSVVLSLERTRVRVRRQGSGLFGTWVPLPRAREMARSVCLESKLGAFLADGIGRTVFGVTKETAVAALKTQVAPPPLPAPVQSSATAAAASATQAAGVGRGKPRGKYAPRASKLEKAKAG
ncbi:hypothetical protein BDK51DRAFT_48346, partial [Blyttiomyces helicus]